jgi:hypothetical protein
MKDVECCGLSSDVLGYGPEASLMNTLLEFRVTINERDAFTG